MTPRVSVVMPTRNRRHTLQRAVGSVQAQSFRNFELIVVVDGSADDSAAWLRANLPWVSLVELAQSGGAAAARNRGIALARGEIIAFLDDDDMWRPDYLRTQLEQLEAHPESDLHTTDHVEIDAVGRTFRPDLRPLYRYADPLIHHLAESPIHTLSVVAVRRAAFERICGFDETLSIVHDLEWYLRLIVSGGKMRHSPEALVERAVPGGLVTQHRVWFREERAVHRRVFAAHPCRRKHQRRIRASRALLFARIAFSAKDFVFGAKRLAEALFAAPLDAGYMALRRLLRYRGPNVAVTWNVETRGSQ
jgi:glycosyltransferase involved in cell wall biosynthesis